MEHYLETCDPLDSRQFLLAVKRLADSLGYGTDKSPFLGSGIEYVQSRPYQAGDPVKAIDWRVTARTGKFFVKEYEAPKRMPIYILIDSSASMSVSSLPMSKYAWAIQIAGGLAFAALDRVSPVGVLAVGTRDFKMEPSLSRDQIMQWLFRLRRFRYDEKTTLGTKVGELCTSLSNRSLIIVLSDMHDPAALPALKLAGQRHDCVVLQLQDPAEVNLRGSGFFYGQEAETGNTFVTHGRRQWLNHDLVSGELKRAGIDHLLLRTDESFVAKLRLFFRSRDLLGRGAR